MPISQRDIKLLWGRAASRCSICKCQVTHDKQTVSTSFPLGEQAHIVAEEPNGPRGNRIIPLEERNSYHNLILLCPTHHTIIDKNQEDYPVEKLHILKSQHELWVQQSLSAANQENIELRPLSDLIEAINYLKPILFWLHRGVPSSEAESFLKALQIFLSHYTIATEHIDSDLISGLESLLRPMASRFEDTVNDRNDGYTKNKVSFAYHTLSSYFTNRGLKHEKGLEFKWEDNYRNLEVTTILSRLEYGLTSVHERKELFDQRQNDFVRLALHITKYFIASMYAKELSAIPQGLVQEFHLLIEPFFNKIGFQLPNSIDTFEIECIREACNSHYSSWDQ